MAETAIPLFADLTNRQLVASVKGGPVVLPSFFHQDKLYLSIQPLSVNPTGGLFASYTTLTGSGYSVRVFISTTAGGTLAGPITSFTTDGTAVAGSVNLNTTEMATAFTSGATLSIAALLTIDLENASGKWTIEKTITIKRSFLTAGTPVANPTVRYLTEADEARFVKYSGNPNGSFIILPNEAGTNSNVIYTGADGAFKADPA